MELSYENNVGDSVALMRYQLATDPDFKKRKRLNLYIYPLIILAGLSMLSVINKEFAGVIGGIIGALIAYVWNWCAYRHHERKLEKHIRGREQKEVYCRHTVTIASEGITEKTAESQNFHSWKAVTRVSFTPDFIYVFNTPVTAHIIPLREVGEAVFQQAAAEIGKYWKA